MEQLRDGTFDVHPFDCLVMSIFNGEHLHPSCVGPIFPDLKTLSNKFNLEEHCDPIDTPEGQWVLTTWKRKTRSQILKTISVMNDFRSKELSLSLREFLHDEEERKEREIKESG